MNTILSIALACAVVAILAVATFGKQTLVVLLFVLAIIFGGITQGATQYAPGESGLAKATRDLSAKIVSVEASSPGYMRPLLVVTNRSEQTYRLTMWECSYWLNGAPVHTDSVHVRAVRPGETPARDITTAYRHDRTDCRLTGARED